MAYAVEKDADPAEYVDKMGLSKIEDSSELDAIVERAIEANADAAEKVRAGKDGAIGPIVGAAMREAKGRADGGEVTRLIRTKLGLG